MVQKDLRAKRHRVRPHRAQSDCFRTPSHSSETAASTINGTFDHEIGLSLLGITVTLIASILFFLELLEVFAVKVADGRLIAAGGHALFALIVVFLLYGGLVYQFTRLEYFRRRARHRELPRDVLESIYSDGAPSLTILIPAYKEEPRVVFRALLSAVLQDYLDCRVVLLIDDPPSPEHEVDAVRLAMIRTIPSRVSNLFGRPASRVKTARVEYLTRRSEGSVDSPRELAVLGDLYFEAAKWFLARANEADASDHVDQFFHDQVLVARRGMLLERAAELRLLAMSEVAENHDRRIEREYLRLEALFSVEIVTFERKRYENLSHEPNKAMNLNSYIALMGGSYRARQRGECLYLDPDTSEQANFSVPDADYVITLDADSVILPDYALRLIHLAEQPENDRMAVIQTPYSSFPGAPGILERVAGATTDIQYIIHQGFTGFGATYWVGANAVLRKSALMDIATTSTERGNAITVFIQDGTVIEDTESTVDLISRGWQLHNYPARLAYSATPPDFGALIIQRQRWANGGLIILPKLIRYFVSGPKTVAKLRESFMRVHYLVSITAVNVGLLIVLAVPFVESMRSPWLPLTAVAYFMLYARDLWLLGYRAREVLDVYALNLLLIPVNLAGVFKSLAQAVTKRKAAFGRTPKIEGRTAAGPFFVVCEYVLVSHWLGQAGIDIFNGFWYHAVFAASNAIMLAYALRRFVGFRQSQDDLMLAFRKRDVGARPAQVSVVFSLPEQLPFSETVPSSYLGNPRDFRAREVAIGQMRVTPTQATGESPRLQPQPGTDGDFDSDRSVASPTIGNEDTPNI